MSQLELLTLLGRVRSDQKKGSLRRPKNGRVLYTANSTRQTFLLRQPSPELLRKRRRRRRLSASSGGTETLACQGCHSTSATAAAGALVQLAIVGNCSRSGRWLATLRKGRTWYFFTTTAGEISSQPRISFHHEKSQHVK